MTAVILLFLTGALLLTAEVFLPGGLAGVLGGLALLGGAILAFVNFGTSVGVTASVGAVALLGVLLYVELVWLPRTRFGRKLVVEATVDGRATQAAPREVVGKMATALTALAPTGVVTIDGQRYEAFNRSGLAPRGAVLTVVDVDNFRLIVSETKSQ